MIGITFKLKNEYNNFLSKIFDNIGVDNFKWNITDNEIIYKDENNHLSTSIFNEDTMNGSNFLKCIEIEKYYLVYADIKAFNNKTKIINIETYNDFINSDCEIALFCTDTVDVELYCKSKIILDKIIENCTRFGFDDLQILTKDKDNRTKFSV
jgi:hypothetical protein